MACLILLSALVQVAASADVRAADQWNWVPASGEEAPKAWISAAAQPDLALAITFPAERRCYTADLMLTNSAGQVLPSERMTVTADGNPFGLSASPSGVVGVYEAPPPVFQALKRARTLRLATSDVEYSFSPAGSAAAINAAWKACQNALLAETTEENNTQGRAAAPSPADDVADDSMDETGDGALSEPPAADTSVERYVVAIVALIFAVGNAFLFVELLAKTVSLPPPLSPLASGRWRRGASLIGAAGWVVLPLMGYATYGLPGAALALAGYLIAGLLLATALQPTVTRYAARHLIDRVRDLRLRIMGVRRGSRLIVEGFRRAARRQATGPTEKTTDAEILRLFERVGSAFKTVASQRGESLKGPRLNHIVWQFLQAHETLSDEAFEDHLKQELDNYRQRGLSPIYRRELEL